MARGEHLVLTAGCHDCHTPLKMGKNGPEPDMSRMLSGHPEGMKLPPAPAPAMPWIVAAAATNTAWAGPWGVSFTANLTPDKETGLGAWSEEEFVQALKTGRHHGRGRPILPPMPIPSYRNFSADELGAIFAYLGSIPALKNQVPDPLPPNAPRAKPRLNRTRTEKIIMNQHNKPTIAVVGATGAQGGGLVRAILADPERRFAVRAITRDPHHANARELARLGAQVVAADLDDLLGLERAFTGVQAAFCVTFYWAHLSPKQEIFHAQNLAKAAKLARVPHVIWSTLEGHAALRAAQ